MNGEQPKTEVVNLHHAEYDVYIGRKGRGHDGYFGNPFDLRNFTREEALAKFEEHFLSRVKSDAVFREKVLSLRGKKLGCFCKPRKCHGDIIVAWIEAEYARMDEASRKRREDNTDEARQAKRETLRALALKNGALIVTPMRTDSDRSRAESIERTLRNREL